MVPAAWRHVVLQTQRMNGLLCLTVAVVDGDWMTRSDGADSVHSLRITNAGSVCSARRAPMKLAISATTPRTPAIDR